MKTKSRTFALAQHDNRSYGETLIKGIILLFFLFFFLRPAPVMQKNEKDCNITALNIRYSMKIIYQSTSRN
jgi:hypothetical protein